MSSINSNNNSSNFNFNTRRVCIDRPKEVIKIERDFSKGEHWQYSTKFPLEFQNKLNYDQFHLSITEINKILNSAFDPYKNLFDSFLQILTLFTIEFIKTSYFESQVNLLQSTLNTLNYNIFNPVGLNILNPIDIGFLYVSTYVDMYEFYLQIYY